MSHELLRSEPSRPFLAEPTTHPTHPSSNTAARKRWNRISHMVTSGEFLLLANNNKGPGEEQVVRRPQARKNFISNFRISLTQCMIAVLCHILVAVIAFSFLLDRWSVIDSIYFAVTTFSTVGYGDLVPSDTHLARTFTCLYALSGVTCLGIVIGVIGSNILDAQHRMIEEAKEASKENAMALFPVDHSNNNHDENPSLSSMNSYYSRLETVLSDQTSFVMRLPRSTTRFLPLLQPRGKTRLAVALALVLVVFCFFGLAVAQDPGIGFAKVPYFLVVTSTTTGFGDVVPVTQKGRLLTAFFIPFAVAAMGNWLALIAGWMIRTRLSQFRSNIEARGLSLQDLAAMDENSDGQVTLLEFLEFMLVAMNQVDKELLDELRQHFARLDVDGSGVLSKEDLVEIARRRLKNTRHKLELARYKARLKEQAEAARANDTRRWGEVLRESVLFHLFPTHGDEEPMYSVEDRMGEAELV